MERLAIYLRLSQEDEGIGSAHKERNETKVSYHAPENMESNSISNQRKQIYEYIQHDPELCKYERVEFCDDGYSGTNMERPGIQKLIAEAGRKRIQCIIVKDISRFSRDYIETGTYLNQVFPFLGIRFIALNDHYDSKRHRGDTIGLDTAFQTLLYDLYSKDISVKVKVSVGKKCADGEFAFGQLPFGYQKSDQEKNAVIVNETEAGAVRNIFSLAMQGESCAQIARWLNSEKIPTVMQMRKKFSKGWEGKVQAWSSKAVRNILDNRFYLGEMVYGKTAVESVGSRRKRKLPKEEWKIIPNHHEALVTPEIFEQVASRQGNCTKRGREKHPLTGALYCGGCGYAMNYKPLRGKNCYRRFECGKHALLKIPECCTCIRADLLEEMVLLMLNRELMLRGDTIRQGRALALFRANEVERLKKSLSGCQQEKKQLQEEKDMLYEKYAMGECEGTFYRARADELAGRISGVEEKESGIAIKLVQLSKEDKKAENDMKQIIRHAYMERLTQEVVDVFVNRVKVFNGKRVEVEWKFGSNGCGSKKILSAAENEEFEDFEECLQE